MIIAKQLTKNFTSYKKQPGITGSIKALFHREEIIKSAVDSFDLNIGKGEIIGLLGPNGAGKTTLMKMFTGIIVPTSGELNIAGHIPSNREREFRKKIALVMGQKSQLWWDIPAMDSFLLLQKYYEISKKDFDDRIKLMSELLDVKRLLHVHLRKLSLGERMKMELMASLLHSPEVIFLDEPTIGLDLVAQENIREFLKGYQKDHNTTLVLTSHYMADVQALCQRLVLIFDGKKAYDGNLHSFEKILGNEKLVSFTFKTAQDSNHEIWKALQPTWNEQFTQVDLRISEESLREISLDILKNFPVTEFNTEKMPIERVMKTLMSNPQILRQAESSK
jgi:ABC-2 type transport system ATP-binding protein